MVELRRARGRGHLRRGGPGRGAAAADGLRARRSTPPASGPGSPARRCSARARTACRGSPARSARRSARSAARRCSRRRSRRCCASPSTRRAPPSRAPARRRLRAAPGRSPRRSATRACRRPSDACSSGPPRARAARSCSRRCVPRRRPRPPPAIVPGSAIGVTLATGDLDAGAIGTAAYVDGTTVWGFGHPFDAAGRRSLFLTAAHVYAVVNNPLATQEAATYKLAAPTATIGTRHAGRRQRRRRAPRRRAARLPGPGVRARSRHAAPARADRPRRRRAGDRAADRDLGALGDRARRDRRRGSTARSTARRSVRAARCACASRCAAARSRWGSATPTSAAAAAPTRWRAGRSSRTRPPRRRSSTPTTPARSP